MSFDVSCAVVPSSACRRAAQLWMMHVEGDTRLKIEARLANFGSCTALYQWSFFNEVRLSATRETIETPQRLICRSIIEIDTYNATLRRAPLRASTAGMLQADASLYA